MPFAFRRYQFPVKLAWSITINKSQGQGFRDRLGVYLPKPVFAHGQLYVALSRAVTAANVKILAEPCSEQQFFVTDADNRRYLQTLNIVDDQILGRPTLASTQPVPPEVVDVRQTPTQPRRRLTAKTTLQQWEQDAASESIPAPPSGPAPPPLSSDKYDGDFDTSALPVQADDVLPAAVDEAVPLTTTDLDAATTERRSPDKLIISRSLFRDDTTDLRLRAKRGEVAVFPIPQIVHEASDSRS